MLESTITRKGQVTIPKAIRDRLGVKEGEKVLFVMRGEEVVLRSSRGRSLISGAQFSRQPTRKILRRFVSL